MPGRTKVKQNQPEEDDTSMVDVPTSAQQPVEEQEDGDVMQEDRSEDPVEEEEEPQRVRIVRIRV